MPNPSRQAANLSLLWPKRRFSPSVRQTKLSLQPEAKKAATSRFLHVPQFENLSHSRSPLFGNVLQPSHVLPQNLRSRQLRELLVKAKTRHWLPNLARSQEIQHGRKG